MEGFVGRLNAELWEHELFHLLKEPFSTNAFYVVGRVYVDGHVCQVLVLFIQELHRFYVSVLS